MAKNGKMSILREKIFVALTSGNKWVLQHLNWEPLLLVLHSYIGLIKPMLMPQKQTSHTQLTQSILDFSIFSSDDESTKKSWVCD